MQPQPLTHRHLCPNPNSNLNSKKVSGLSGSLKLHSSERVPLPRLFRHFFGQQIYTLLEMLARLGHLQKWKSRSVHRGVRVFYEFQEYQQCQECQDY